MTAERSDPPSTSTNAHGEVPSSNGDGGAYAKRPGGWALLAGLLLAPAAWFMQTDVAQTLAAQICFPHERPVASPALPWLMPALVALSVVALVIGLIGFGIAWRNWRCTRELAAALAAHRRVGRNAARDCFLARVGTISSALFMFGLVAADAAMLIVSPCAGG